MKILKSYLIRHCKSNHSLEELSFEEFNDLLTQKSNPEINNNYLRNYLDILNLKKFNFEIIYSSPLKRAYQTAEFISNKLNIPIKTLDDLSEIIFNPIPIKTYKKGQKPVILNLYNQCNSKYVDLEFLNQIKDNSLLISHGFTMTLLYSKLFDIPIKSLINDKKFVTYLSGFDLINGEFFSFNKTF